ncbi:MAG: hypothetical protein K2R98_22450 [Gemmataceae bacterium]|nr:hypothetical protein [Gemmataceae bacterium]
MVVPKLRAPIVLVHGLLGFDELKLCGWTLASYFPGIPEFLRAAGNHVLVPRLSMTCGVAERAAQLRDYLDLHIPNEPVHLLAHSMGGLDSRYLISRLGLAKRVLSLTTIGTPHRGTAFADWGIRRLERVLKPIFDMLCIPREAFYDLTIERCRRFNEEVTDAPGVRYFSVAGRHENDWRDLRWHLPHFIVTQMEGENDGVVSVASATYGEDCDLWDGDHLTLVNWPDPRARSSGTWTDRAAHYTRLVSRLADAGF